GSASRTQRHSEQRSRRRCVVLSLVLLPRSRHGFVTQRPLRALARDQELRSAEGVVHGSVQPNERLLGSRNARHPGGHGSWLAPTHALSTRHREPRTGEGVLLVHSVKRIRILPP